VNWHWELFINVIRLWIILNVIESEWRLREIRKEERMVGLRVMGKIWKCPDGMHRLEARGLPPGACAEVIILRG